MCYFDLCGVCDVDRVHGAARVVAWCVCVCELSVLEWGFAWGFWVLVLKRGQGLDKGGGIRRGGGDCMELSF